MGGESVSTLPPWPPEEPSGQNTDRFTNSHRKASSPKLTTHETHTVASQKQLESTRVTRKSDSNSQVPAPPLTMVAKGRPRSYRPTITPNKTCSANLYRRIKRRVGCSLKWTHCKRVLVTTRKQATHKLSGTKSSLSSPERVPRPLYRQDSTCCNWQRCSSVLHKQGRRHEVGPTVCPAMENLDLVYQTASNSQSPTHSGPAERGSGQAITTRPNHPNRVVSPSRGLPDNMQQVAPASNRPSLPRGSTTGCLYFLSPVPDALATAVDALSLPWEDLDAYGFPPAVILGKVMEKLQDTPCKRIIQIAPSWPNMPWFWDLVAMSSQIPLTLLFLPNLLTQPFNQIPHRNLTNLNLHAWLLEPQQSKSRASLRQWKQELRLLKEDQPDQSTRQSGPFLQSGASLIRWTSGHPL